MRINPYSTPYSTVYSAMEKGSKATKQSEMEAAKDNFQGKITTITGYSLSNFNCTGNP